MRACSAALPSELSALLWVGGSRPLNAGARYLKSAAHRRRGAAERSPGAPTGAGKTHPTFLRANGRQKAASVVARSILTLP
jgi:hypothetical protein